MKANKRLLYLLQIIAFIVFCSGSKLAAREISMVTNDWAPFFGSELENDGAVTVIVKAAFQRVGHNAEIKFVPWLRALKLVKYGEHDLLMGAYYSDERSKTYLYSDPFWDIKLGLVAPKSLNINHYSKLQDLTPYKIGIVQGWVNSPEFDAADYLNKQETTNQILNVRKLLKNRVDMIVTSYDIFRYEVATQSGYTHSDFVFIQPPLNSHKLHLIVSHQLPEGKKIIRDFNKGLAAIKQDGTYDKILKEYGF